MKATTRLTLVCLLITLVVLGAATATPWRLNPPELTTPELTMPTPETQPSPSGSPSQAATQENPPPPDLSWLVPIITAIITILATALIILVIRELLAARSRRMAARHDNLTGGTAAGADDEAVNLPELQDAVTRALAHLDGHARPRDAVVAAWVALEEAAARAGTHRNPAQTPTEFAGTVLAATPAPPTAVTHLRTLYQRARFTDRPIDAPAVNQAREALADIARSLDVKAPVRAPVRAPVKAAVEGNQVEGTP
ncbi:DUF4129 domain-containing protein [Promicromonospora sp. Populi]|uniref:DUF4129 domain-containing protein n=1 Tax=Promicromonospora sp. Populi TaxID=3239420 RepID=UPI0034E2F9C2